MDATTSRNGRYVASPIGFGRPTPPNPRQRFQLSNQVESASVELTETGSIISYEEYFPFGATSFRSAEGSGNVSAKRYRYTGKERDEETALYYHGARYYAPWLGRWTAVDPAGNAFGTRYGYAGNHPIHAHDPDGREEVNRSTSTRPNTASTLDRSDPRNYSSFEEYAQNAPVASSSSTTPEQLRKNWDAVHPAAPQQTSPQQASTTQAKTPETSLGVLLEQGAKVLGGKTTVGSALLTTAEAHAFNIVTSIPNVAAGVALYRGVQATREAYTQGGAGAAGETGAWAYGSYLWGLVPVLPTVGRIIERYGEAERGEASAPGAVGDIITMTSHAAAQAVGVGVGVEKAAVESTDPNTTLGRFTREQTGAIKIGTWEIPDAAEAKIPSSWGAGALTKKGVGWRWSDPTNPQGAGVRIDKGDPSSPFPSQRVDHVIVRSGGKVIGRSGAPITSSIEGDPVEAHIPLDEWLQWGAWNKP